MAIRNQDWKALELAIEGCQEILTKLKDDEKKYDESVIIQIRVQIEKKTDNLLSLADDIVERLGENDLSFSVKFTELLAYIKAISPQKTELCDRYIKKAEDVASTRATNSSESFEIISKNPFI